MRITFSKENILKSSILFSTVSVFFLLALLFTSCSDAENLEITEDANLIEQIETASKFTVEVTELPSASTAAFSGELADSYVESAQLASGLGYKVVIITMNESRSEAKSEVFFSLRGRQLNDTNEKRVRKRNKCFQFVFPVDFIMPDNSSITLNSKEEWVLIKEWYTLNPDVSDKPALVFPVDITLEDGTVQTLLDREELEVIKDSCKRGKDKRKCFKLILPVSFTMPDASEIQVNERADFRLVRAWHKANPDATEKGNLNFPVDIEFKDGTLETVNDEVAYIAAKESCTD